jgi:propionyl-CoA synthetase
MSTTELRLAALAQHLHGPPAPPSRGPAPLAPADAVARAEYDAMFEASVTEPEAFWGAAAEAIDWDEPYTTLIRSPKEGFHEWFGGGSLSMCHNCVDRHLADRAEQAAIIYDSPATGAPPERISYRELRDRVASAAGMLRALGVGLGDRVVVYMPMIPEAVYAMLACARLGAVHSVVFGGFAAPELAVRIDDARPAAVLTASCGLEGSKVIDYMPLLNRAIELAAPANRPLHVVVKQRPQSPWPAERLEPGRDLDWDAALAAAAPAGCVSVPSTHPLYILYTSGSTGKPKGIVRDTAGHAVALKWSMREYMRTEPGEVYWAASDVGWVVGHSYIVYGPLLHGCSTVLYEGKPVGTPDAGAIWRVIAEHRVRAFFTAPTALRAVRKEDPSLELLKSYDVSCLRALFVAGERCDPTTSEAYAAALGVDVLDNYWQTETGWPICGFQDTAVGAVPGSCGLPFPGYRLEVLDEHGAALGPNEPGALVVRLPLPPSCFPTLWENDAGFEAEYLNQHSGYYTTGDAGVIDGDGYVSVLERMDDVINVAAHRLSAGNIEAVVKAQAGVADAAVVGAADDFKGQVPLAVVVLAASAAAGDEAALIKAIQAAVRSEVSPVAALAGVCFVEQLPKTRSGKVLRKNIRGLADGKEVAVPGTIDNPEAFALVAAALATIGYPTEG